MRKSYWRGVFLALAVYRITGVAKAPVMVARRSPGVPGAAGKKELREASVGGGLPVIRVVHWRSRALHVSGRRKVMFPCRCASIPSLESMSSAIAKRASCRVARRRACTIDNAGAGSGARAPVFREPSLSEAVRAPVHEFSSVGIPCTVPSAVKFPDTFPCPKGRGNGHSATAIESRVNCTPNVGPFCQTVPVAAPPYRIAEKERGKG